MKIPDFLKKGDTIGVTAPSAGVTETTDKARFANAKARLADRGYNVRETPNVYMCDEDGRSSPAEQRVSELMSLLEDPSIAAVFAASGGDYECEMLSLMDWNAIERNPKWIQGYSDNTVLLFKITAEHDIATIYSGNFGDFGMEPWHRSIFENLEFLEGIRSSQTSFDRHASGFADRVTGLEPFKEDVETVWRSNVGDVSFSGRLIGGCMDVIEWFLRKDTADASGFIDRYSGEGIVWYLETFDMDEERVTWTLREMASKGWLDGCSGFIFGRPLFYSGRDYGEVVCGVLSEFRIPVLWDADVGHKAPRMTFINGAKATFSYKDGGCVLLYDLNG